MKSRERGEPEAFPEISIELYLDNQDDLQHLCGAINSDIPTNACPGIALRIVPNPEYAQELESWAESPTNILPIEYYIDDWRSFADKKITARPRQLSTAIIDARTVRSTSGIDYHLREILRDHLEPSERAAIALAYRKIKADMSNDTLGSVNERIENLNAALHDRPLSLAMDQSAKTSWEGSIAPYVDKVPFSMSGQGQQAAIKISLAMNKHSENANFVMAEEPENHLSHTSLTTLLSRMEALTAEHQQLFISTHSTFVLNRLGLDSILLIGADGPAKISNLTPETVAYFKKLPGYDTLRMALASKIVLVEGPSDEIVFERVFKDIHGKRPMDLGIDVISMRGLSLKRCLEFCKALDKKVAALRDNDGIPPDELANDLEDWLSKGTRQLFVGKLEQGETLEPQLLHFNGEDAMRKILGITDKADVTKWMKREKTEGALRILETDKQVKPPEYMREAAKFIHA